MRSLECLYSPVLNASRILIQYKTGGVFIMKLFGTMATNETNQLEVGGCNVFQLAEKFDTPLYVVDVQHVKDNCNLFSQAFKKPGIDTEVIYASKAFLNMAMCRLIQDAGLSLDVVSGGELFTAIKAGFPADRIYMHGNNKTTEELLMALDYGIKRIVVDNEHELELLSYLCDQLGKSIDILLRVNPGIEAHTHEYIQTSKNDSKFGISIYHETICDLIHKIEADPNVHLQGFHCHIGSQIFEDSSFFSAVSVMLGFVERVQKECDFTTAELNLGGGFGVYYSGGDDPFDLNECLQQMLNIFQEEIKTRGLTMPKLLIEPGRAIIANAGTTLYRVGGIKRTYGGKNFIFVDGGMTDNPRTALYDSKYEAMISSKSPLNEKENFTIAGKCCESGDILIKEIPLPTPQVDDLLTISCTGAYNYSMSSNYNRNRRPAVVFVEEGVAKLAVKRETFDDLIRNDI